MDITFTDYATVLYLEDKADDGFESVLDSYHLEFLLDAFLGKNH